MTIASRLHKLLGRRSHASNRRRLRPRTFFQPLIESLEDRRLLTSYLVKDINTGTNGSNPSAPILGSSTVLFAATDGINGTELWRSDGTDSGTTLVKDIIPGAGSSSPSNITKVGSQWLFRNGSDGRLWKSDGTAVGTVLVSTALSNPQNLIDVNGTLYFQGQGSDGSGTELWKSDGTAAGTIRVKDINPGSGSSSPANLFNLGGTVYFAANEGPSIGVELWRSDGTEAGTVRVKDIYSTSGNSAPSFLTEMNGTLYFFATDANGGAELWRSDGTDTGTTRVKDIVIGPTGSGPSELVRVGNKLFFAAQNETTGDRELWGSDGSEAGTIRLRSTQSGTIYPLYPRNLTASNGFVYFASDWDSRLWKSDGTAGGTVQVATNVFSPGNLTDVNGILFFQGSGSDNTGAELWKTNGTAAGTVRVKDVFPGVASSSLSNFRSIGGLLYFSANDGASGIELWRSDGTGAGTARVKDANAVSAASNPTAIVEMNGLRYFFATDSDGGTELWRTDGTEAGTTRVKDIVPGPTGSSPSELVRLGNKLFFGAQNDTNSDRELWVSDGTDAGTVRLRSTNPSTLYPLYPRNLTVSGGVLYFRSDWDNRLWKSDGTAAGTVQIATNLFGPVNLTDVNGVLFFQGSGSDNSGAELWKSNGTAAGTVRVKDIFSGSGSSNPGNFRNINGTLYFTATDPFVGTEIWTTNGTEAGTVPYSDVFAGPAGSSPSAPVLFGDSIYFSANDGFTGNELWKTDLASGVTTQVKDISLGSNSSSPAFLTAAGGSLYFRNSQDGRLWKSDGTSSGTVLASNAVSGVTTLTESNGTLFFVGSDSGGNELWMADTSPTGAVRLADINPGSNSSSPQNLASTSGYLYFSADDGVSGRELWRTDGLTTSRVADINNATASASPSAPVAVGGTIFFTANDGFTGLELYKTDGTSGGTARVADLAIGPNSSSPQNLTAVGATLYFTNNADSGRLWKSDGTAAGTNRVSSNVFGVNSLAIGPGGDLFFSGFGSDGSGAELWKSDGTESGTIRVLNIHPTSSSSPQNLVLSNDLLFFSADDGLGGRELWASDGNPGSRPVAFSQFVTAQEDSAQAITLQGQDPDNDSLTFEIVSGTTSGMLNGSGSSFTYTPASNFSGSDSFTFRVFDGTSYSNVATVSITVVSVNDLPVVDAGGDQTSTEGASVAFSGRATDVEDTALTYSWDFGDGQTGAGPTVTHIFRDNGNYTVTLRVRDTQGGEGTDTLLVSVANAVPIVTALNVSAATINEGDSVTVTGALTDAGTLDTHSVTVDWGDGTSSLATMTQSAGSATFTATHSYTDDRPSGTAIDVNTITVRATDDDGESSAPLSRTVTISNVAPTVDGLNVTSPVDENGTATLSGTIADPGAGDTFTLVVDWSDGSGAHTYTLAAGTTFFSVAHQYLDDNPTATPFDLHAVNIISLTDDDGGSAGLVRGGNIYLTGHDILSHGNQNGYSVVVLDYLRGRGTPLELARTGYDIGVVNVNSAFLPDPRNAQAFGTLSTLNIVSTTTAAQFATFLSSVDVLVIPEISGSTNISRFSTFAPQIEDFFNAGGDLFVDTSNGQANYYGFLPSVIGADGPGINQSAGFSATAAGVAIGILSNMVNGFPTHNTYQSPSSVFTIFETHAQGTVSIGAQNVVISDGGLGQALGTTVRNVAPDFPAQANAVLTPADAGAFTRTINFNDPGTLDSHKVTIDWGDGSFSPLGQVLSVTPVGSRSFTLSHTYTREGTFPVSVKLSDDDTGALTHTFQVTVDLNNPPSSADSATATGEDVPYAFSAGDFIFSDPDAGDALAAVEITTLPAAGVLFVDLNGNGHDDGGSETRTAGGTVSIADINAGRFKFRSLAHQSGNPYTSFKFRVSDGEEWSAAAATMTIRVNPVADAPTLSVSGASGNEDAAIPLAISALLVDVDGSETLSINFSGVPAGAALSAGTNNGGGSWTLTAADLPSLTVTPPLHSDGEFTLAVTATSTEVGNGHQAQSLATLAVVVNAVADVPTLSVAAASGLENSPIPLAIASFLVDGDGSESLAITVAGIPAGATLNHGINGGGGTWTLTPADLAGLTITTPDDAQFTLTVTATATESNPSSTNPGVSLLAASRSASIDVTVANIAPTITLNDISSIDENGVATLTGSIADASASSGVVHIDFEELAHSGSGVGPSFNQFHSHGFTFTGYSAALGVGGDAQALTSMGSNTPSAYPGSAGLVNRFFDGTTLLTADNGQPFDLLSLDLSESNRDLANANRTITLVGTRSDSSTVSRSITTDGTFGFQTVLFSNFTDLVSVHWRNVSSVHIDNVRLAADAGDTFALSIDWGDPLSPANTETIDLTSPPAHVEWDASTRTFSVTHRYLDDNPTASGSDIYTVNVTATDDDGGSSGVSSSAVEVNNVAPTLSGLSATSILENGTTTLTGTIADVGVLDTFTVVIDWGNGAETVTNVSAGAFSYTRHYLDDNAADSYPISVTVTDDDLGIVAAGTTVGVANVAPALTLNAVTAIVENGIATLTGTIADPGTLDTFTLVIDWGDPLSPNNVETYIFAASATSSQSFTLTHQYLDDNPSATAFNSYMIAVAVADDDAGSVSVATSVLVHNAAPQGLTISATSVDENGIVTVTGTFTDPGTLDTHKVEIDWSGAGPGEGNTTITTAGPNPAGTSLSFLNGVWTFSATHQYLDDNPTGTSADSYLIGVDVSDDDQGTAGKTTLITVTNVAPTLTNLAATAILENGTTTLTGTIADVGSQDTFQVEIDWNNDGLIDETHTGLSAGPFSYTRQFLDDVPTGTPVDQSPIRVIVTDDDSGSIAAGTVVEVTNVAPTLTLNAIAAIVENGVATLTGTIVDPGTLDTFTVSINWGDPLSPNIVETYTFPASAAGSQTFTLTHQYLDDNGSGTSVDTYTISATVTDDDTGSGSASQTVLVANVAPTLAGLSATSILENGVTTLTGTIADVGSLDTFTIVIDWGNGIETFTNVGAGPFSYARQFLDDSPTGTPVDNLPISVTVTDDDTGTVSVTTAVTVTNVAPVVTSLANSSPCCGQADENEGVTLSATFTDVGTLDTHTSTIDWGDGSTTDGIVVESGGAGSVSGSHAYAQGGIYTITLTVMDDDTGSVSQSTLTVIAGAGVHAGVLQIIGTAGDDQVMINKEGAGQLQVHASFFATNHRTYDLAGISETLIIMCGGDDQVSVGGSVDLKTTIDGGEGNDHLNGGSGTNLILGGAGNDHINGGTARDILIGGLGADRIIGNSQDDILIAGTTDDDNDLDALYALLAEWSRTDRTYAERVAALSASLNDQTVHDDDASDTLTGSAANDWFFVNLESGVLDSVTDGKSGESLTDSY